MNQITFTKPDDWHLHLRDDQQMASAVMHTAKYYKRAIVMPNLANPVFTLELARQYRERILSALGNSIGFEPLMTIYLTGDTTSQQVLEVKESGIVYAIKLYPAGATTNSARGVRDLDQCDAVFTMMEKIGMPLAVHGEVTDSEVDIFDREKVFIEKHLSVLVKRYPDLKIILEHITTKDAVQFVESCSNNVGATITAHHILLNRNNILVGGIQPHHYCLPVVKTEEDRKAVLNAATSGNPKFFLGTDSAPHARKEKESATGKAGIYSSPVSLPIYIEMFEKENKLDQLEGFASFFGADFYSLPRNQETITFKKEETIVPDKYEFADDYVVPLKASDTVQWKLVE